LIKAQGVDLVDIRRIRTVWERFNQRFVERVLTPNERDQCDGYMYLAKRFAAKEAVSKALGTGIGKEVSFQDIEVLRVPGRPATVSLHRGALTRLESLGASQVLLSISDERNYAIAMVTIQ